MKAKYALVILLVAVLALTGVGCKKVTGGGWFIGDFSSEHPGNKISFGFNAHPLGIQGEEYDVYPEPGWEPPEQIKAKGQFQMVDHTAKTKYHGTFNGTYAYIQPDNMAHFSGTLLMDGNPTDFCVVFSDTGESGASAGDWIEIFIGTKDYPGIGIPSTYGGSLQGGNTQVHKK